MKLSFVYVPTSDVPSTAAFYSDVLGLDEAWRDEPDTIAFQLPGLGTQLMVSTTPQPPGPMFLVDDLTQWLAARRDLTVIVERYDIPGGSVIGLADNAGNPFYVFDQISTA